jgi:hypothetical protein
MPSSTSEPTRVRAAGDALLVAEPAVTPADLVALSDALLWSQAFARTIDRDPASAGYFDGMSRELGRVAWNVIEATDAEYAAKAVDVAPVAVVDAVLDEQALATRRLFAAVQRHASADTDAALRFWWASTQSVSQTRFWIGPVQRDRSGVVTARLVWFDLQFGDTAWRSLFVARRTQQLAVRLRRLTVTLNAPLWAELAADIEDRLAAAIRGSVRDLDIDL